MRVIKKTIDLSTKPGEFYVITDKVRDVVKETGVTEGICMLFLPSTTSFILLQENCELLKKDFKKLFSELAPPNRIYTHPDNAYSHLLAGIFGSEKLIPIEDGELALGTWQDIIFYEADVKPRKREIRVFIFSFNEEIQEIESTEL